MIAREQHTQRKLITNNLHAPPNLFQAIFGRLKNAFSLVFFHRSRFDFYSPVSSRFFFFILFTWFNLVVTKRKFGRKLIQAKKKMMILKRHPI